MNIGTMRRASNVFLTLLYAKLFRKKIPVRVALQITKYCNMKCNYCYTNFDTYQKTREKSTEEIFAWIDDLYAHGTRALWFLGGEPMMRKDFGEIIDYATGKGIFCDMNSNGTLINEKTIDVVKKLDGVCISLDGDEESNDFYRGKGSYQKAVEAIKLLRKHGITVRLHAILTKKTLHKLDHMVNLSRELGTMFNYCEVMLHDPNRDDHLLTDEDSKAFYQKYYEYKKQGCPIMHSLTTIEYMMRWPKKDSYLIYRDEASRYPKNSFVPCIAGELDCFYDLDGQLYACPATWDNGLNCNEVGFERAWEYLSTRKCVGCKSIGATELNMVLGLHTQSLMNSLKNVLSLK